MGFLLLLAVAAQLGCAPAKPKVQTPVAIAPPPPEISGPASELENQNTSTPVVIPNSPLAPIEMTEVKPVPQPEQPQPAPRKTAPPREPARKETRPAAPTETAAATPPPPAFQITPLLTEAEKTEMSRKISQELDAARALVRNIDASRLSSEQKTNLSAIQDFFRKSEEATHKGDYYQALVVAQKAHTLASSLAKQ